jgi:hypothetical protein
MMGLVSLGACAGDAQLGQESTDQSETRPSDSPNHSGGLTTDPRQIVNIGFGDVVYENEISATLATYRLHPTAVFISVGGLNGSYRIYENQDLDTMLAGARESTRRTLEKSLKSNRLRMEEFVSKNSPDAVRLDPRLNEMMRTLLRFRHTAEGALAAVNAGRPIIHSVEVRGAQARLADLINDRRVRRFEFARELNGRLVVPSKLMPPPSYRVPDAATVQALNVPQLFERFHGFARRDRRP